MSTFTCLISGCVCPQSIHLPSRGRSCPHTNKAAGFLVGQPRGWWLECGAQAVLSSSCPGLDFRSPPISSWLKVLRLSAASVCTGGGARGFVSRLNLLLSPLYSSDLRVSPECSMGGKAKGLQFLPDRCEKGQEPLGRISACAV